MVVSIELGPQGDWHLILNEQFNIRNGSKKPHEVMDYLMDKGIIFGVTYSDYGLHIHLQNVEYVDDNYDNFLKVASDMLLFKKKFSYLEVPQTDEEKIQSVIGPQPVQPEEPLAESIPTEESPAGSAGFVDKSVLKQPPKQ